MTNEEREEALAIMNVIIHMIEKQYDNDRVEKAVDMAIAALKAETCEDAVKREAVLNTLDTMDKALDENRTVEAYKELLKECYKALPPVTPKPLDSVLDEIRAEIPKLSCGDNEYRQALVKVADVIKCIDKHREGNKE